MQYFNFFLIILTRWLFPQLTQYVHFKIEFPSEMLLTVITFIIQNFKMLGLPMHSEINLLGETGCAQVTFVRFFLGVYPYVVEELAHALLGVVAPLMLTLK